MATQFPTYINNTYATLASGYTAGSGALVLTAGQGAQFGSSFPLRVTLITAGTYATTAETLTIFSVTARTGDTLTVAVAEGSTDRNYAAGDVVEMRWTAGDANLISTAINAIENAPYAVDGQVVHLAGAETISGVKTFSSTIVGNISGNAGTVTNGVYTSGAGTVFLAPGGSGSSLTGITESQVTGLVADLAAKATDSLVVHLAGSETISGAKTFGSVPTLPSQTANRIFAGPGTGVAAAPTFRALVGADLPAPSATTLGGIQSAAAVAHQWIASISTTGVPSLSQPAFTDISGSAAVAQLPVMAASGASHAAGIAPDPGVTAGTTRFLREDATWAIPAGGGGSPGGSSGQIQYNSSAAFAGASLLTVGASGNLNLGSQAAPGTPTNGDLWLDSTQLCQSRYDGGITNYRLGLLFSQVTNVTQATPSAASLVSTTSAIGTRSLPAGFLNVAGRTIRIKAAGYLSTAAVNGSTQFAIALGASVVSTTVSLGLGANRTKAAWSLECVITTKAGGASGKLDTGGLATVSLSGSLGNLANGTTMGTQAPDTQITLDLTAAYAVDVLVTCSATGNSVTQTLCTIEVLA